MAGTVLGLFIGLVTVIPVVPLVVVTVYAVRGLSSVADHLTITQFIIAQRTTIGNLTQPHSVHTLVVESGYKW